MAGPSPNDIGPASTLRVEILKELQSMLDDREVRDRVDRGPLAETKGREHWVLHLLLRAQELSQASLTTLVRSAYTNLTGRLQTLEERVQRIEANQRSLSEELKSDLQALTGGVQETVTKTVDRGLTEGRERIGTALLTDLDAKWKPIGESIETFARSSHQLSKDLSDTYRVSTQTRLLLNENARRMIDLGRDLVALEESLKLALTKALEDGLQPLEDRIAALEGRLANPEAVAEGTPRTDPPSG
jgi:predicted  nucleic acid-binding Zn-ribbon protein